MKSGAWEGCLEEKKILEQKLRQLETQVNSFEIKLEDTTQRNLDLVEENESWVESQQILTDELKQARIELESYRESTVKDFCTDKTKYNRLMDSYKNLKQSNKKLVTRLEYRERELSALVGDLSSKKSEVFEKEMCLNRELNQNLLLTDELAKSREAVRLQEMDIGQMTQTKKELKRALRENKQILVQSQKFENKLKMALERENVYKERMSMYETSKAIFTDNKKYLEEKLSDLEVEIDGYKTENESLIKQHSEIFKKLDSKESDITKLINVLSNNSEPPTQKNSGNCTP